MLNNNKLKSAWGWSTKMRGVRFSALTNSVKTSRGVYDEWKDFWLGSTGYVFKWWTGSAWRVLADLANNQLFMGTLDGHLISVNVETGKLI